jgi:hypothetical protein
MTLAVARRPRPAPGHHAPQHPPEDAAMAPQTHTFAVVANQPPGHGATR